MCARPHTHFLSIPGSARCFSSSISNSQRLRTCSSSFGSAGTKSQICLPLKTFLFPQYHPVPFKHFPCKVKGSHLRLGVNQSYQKHRRQSLLPGEVQEPSQSRCLLRVSPMGLDGTGIPGRKRHVLRCRALQMQETTSGEEWQVA